MPTAIGAETIGERLKRLRAELTRVRVTIARAEDNGQANALGGVQITEIAYERALGRQRELQADIAGLEARLLGSVTRPGLAQLQTRIES